MSTIRKLILQRFRENGLMIQSDACENLCNILADNEANLHENLNSILQSITLLHEKKEITSTVITLDILTNIIADLTADNDDLQEESIQLIDAFPPHSPKLDLDEVTKSYKIIKNTGEIELIGGVQARADLFRKRLLFIRDRLLRSGNFTVRGARNVNVSTDGHPVYEIYNVQDLLGSKGSKVLVGILTQPKDGVWHLEDLTATIPIDLTHAQTDQGLHTEGSIVIIQGELFSTQLFRVTFIGPPPAEDRATTLNAIGYYDIFGTRPQQIQDMSVLESNALSVMFVILSDVHLDKPSGLDKLHRLFSGFDQAGVAPLFILMGTFVTKQSAKGLSAATAAFNALADTICTFPMLAKQAKFVLVPGPDDIGDTAALPRRAIPQKLTDNLRKRVNHVSFGSNPCRIKFYTQEIVLFRENLTKKMQRHAALMPNVADEHIADLVTAAVVDQAHLCPLPLQVRPIIWSLDYTLHLTPLPHLIVLADASTEAFEKDHCGCSLVNPGSFASDSCFIVYRPAVKSIEMCKLP